MLLQGQVVDSIRVVDASIVLCDTDQPGAFLGEVFAGPVSHVSEALDDQRFALETHWDLEVLSNGLVVEELFGAGEDSQTSRFRSAADAELVEVFSSGNSIGVDVLVAVESLVSGLHPTHLSLASTHIRSRHID